MLFSKSFGYALRGILYITKLQDENRNIQVDEIATQLSVPRHFMGKVLKKLVKEKMLKSAKGPTGGFTLNSNTLYMSLWSLYEITDGHSTFKNCVLRLSECNAQNPCPLHCHLESVKNNLKHILITTNIEDLMDGDKKKFIKSLSSMEHENILEFIENNKKPPHLS